MLIHIPLQKRFKEGKGKRKVSASKHLQKRVLTSFHCLSGLYKCDNCTIKLNIYQEQGKNDDLQEFFMQLEVNQLSKQKKTRFREGIINHTE